jgi:hypothetical protein
VLSQPTIIDEHSPKDIIHIPGLNPHPIFNASCHFNTKREISPSLTAKRIFKSPNKAKISQGLPLQEA